MKNLSDYTLGPVTEPGEPIITPEMFASLPEWARHYIHNLETRADPAGDVQRMLNGNQTTATCQRWSRDITSCGSSYTQTRYGMSM